MILNDSSFRAGPVRTNFDKSVFGDGFAGLARAVVYAGATSVISTLWDVADHPRSRPGGALQNRNVSGEQL